LLIEELFVRSQGHLNQAALLDLHLSACGKTRVYQKCDSAIGQRVSNQNLVLASVSATNSCPAISRVVGVFEGFVLSQMIASRFARLVEKQSS